MKNQPNWCRPVRHPDIAGFRAASAEEVDYWRRGWGMASATVENEEGLQARLMVPVTMDLYFDRDALDCWMANVLVRMEQPKARVVNTRFHAENDRRRFAEFTYIDNAIHIRT